MILGEKETTASDIKRLLGEKEFDHFMHLAYLEIWKNVRHLIKRRSVSSLFVSKEDNDVHGIRVEFHVLRNKYFFPMKWIFIRDIEPSVKVNYLKIRKEEEKAVKELDDIEGRRKWL